MAIKASEISELIKARIQNFAAATEARTTNRLLVALIDQLTGIAVGSPTVAYTCSAACLRLRRPIGGQADRLCSKTMQEGL